MYECITVISKHESDPLLNEEGDLDNESEDSEFENEMNVLVRKKAQARQNRDSPGSSVASADASSVEAVTHGSPMSVD